VILLSCEVLANVIKRAIDANANSLGWVMDVDVTVQKCEEYEGVGAREVTVKVSALILRCQVADAHDSTRLSQRKLRLKQRHSAVEHLGAKTSTTASTE
jgi:hypothetical protein